MSVLSEIQDLNPGGVRVYVCIARIESKCEGGKTRAEYTKGKSKLNQRLRKYRGF